MEYKESRLICASSPRALLRVLLDRTHPHMNGNTRYAELPPRWNVAPLGGRIELGEVYLAPEILP